MLCAVIEPLEISLGARLGQSVVSQLLIAVIEPLEVSLGVLGHKEEARDL